MTVMDFGAGTGLLTLYIQPYVEKIYAIDNSEGMLSVLKEKIENARKIGEAVVSSIPLSKDMTVMDFGAGTGLLTLYIQPYVEKIYAIDNSDGTFHDDNTGVYHHGFDKDYIERVFKEIGFKEVNVKTVNKIEKNGREYGVFLIAGRKL